jgi:hypothetical protein
MVMGHYDHAEVYVFIVPVPDVETIQGEKGTQDLQEV